MKSYLKYIGEIPRYALKVEWVKNQMVSIDELYKTLGSRCTTTDKLDFNFLQWLKETHLDKLGRDFEFLLDREEFPIDLISDPQEEWDDSDTNQILVESSSIQTSPSFQEAQARLRTMRHPDAVGEVLVDRNEMRTNKTESEMIKSLPKPGTQVLSGDDLEKHSVIKTTGSNILALNEKAESIKAIPTSKEEQEVINNKFANLSGKIKYLQPSDDGKSIVITGDALENSNTSNALAKHDNVRVVNKDFQSFPSSEGSAIEILPQHISNAPTEKDAISLINKCNNSTTLKVARIYLENVGNHKLMDIINDRLRRLPPGM